MKRFSNILYVSGAGTHEVEAFGRAVKLAKNNQAKLTVVSVIENLSDIHGEHFGATNIIDIVVSERRELIQQLVDSEDVSKLEIEIKIFTGKAFIDIIHEVIAFKRDLLIKAIDHRETLIESMFESTDIKLLRKCPCPVWLIKSQEDERSGYKEILVALDYDPNNPENEKLNLQMLSMALSLAMAEFSNLHIVHAWQFEYESLLRSSRLQNSDDEVDSMIKKVEDERKSWLTELVNKSIEGFDKESSSYINPELHLLKGDAGVIVPQLTSSLASDLVVMGTVGRTGIVGYIIGNTAETILNHIDCSVLTIKPESFISPIKL